jgi:hypothetical protein
MPAKSPSRRGARLPFAQAWRLRLSPLAEALTGQPLAEPSLALRPLGETQLLATSEQGRFVFDRERRQVQHGQIDIAAFDDVKSVEITVFPGGRGAPSWAVSLYLGRLRRIPLGRTYDDGDASVTAARLARLLGCKVLSMTWQL